jgi:hypothetical protein
MRNHLMCARGGWPPNPTTRATGDGEGGRRGDEHASGQRKGRGGARKKNDR